MLKRSVYEYISVRSAIQRSSVEMVAEMVTHDLDLTKQHALLKANGLQCRRE